MMQMLHVMARHPETVRPEDMLLKAKEMMDAGGFRRLPVVYEGRIVGILTERDLREHGGYLKSTKVDAAVSLALDDFLSRLYHGAKTRYAFSNLA